MQQQHTPLRVFQVEIRTQTGQFAHYTALAPSSCAALLDALEKWGIAKINVSPYQHAR